MIKEQRERSDVPTAHLHNGYPGMKGFSSITMPITQFFVIWYKITPYLQQLVAESLLEHPRSKKRTILSGIASGYRRSIGAGAILEQWTLSMSWLDEWFAGLPDETGNVTPAVAQLRGMANVTHPVINQRILAKGGGR